MRGKGSDPPESKNGENPGASSGIAIQQRLESIFRAAPVGIGLVRSRIILEVNRKLCEMTGYTREELMGKSAIMLYPSREEFDRVGREKYAQIERSGTGTIETVWKRSDGTLLDVLLSSSALDRTDPDKGFTFSALDITEEKKAKAAEEANAALLRIAGETARFGGWDVNLETNISTWSDTVCDIHGMPRGFAPLVEKGIEFYAPEYRETITRVFKACAEEGIPYSEELEIIDGNGGRVWVKTIGKPVRDENGNITGVHGSFQDISDQKRPDEQLRSYSERMDFLLRATNTNINIMNEDYTLSFVDDRWRQVYGDFEGKKCHSYFMGKEAPCEGCGVPEALRTRKVVVSQEYLPKEDRFVEVHTIPFQNREGSWQLAEFNIDITKRKRAEEEREKLRFQLMQMMKMESVGRLAGGVAHDFNNMLGVILGNAEMTLEKLDPSMPIYGELTEIRNAARRSADLTRQLLTFARKQTIAPRLIDLNETVEGMLQMLSRLVGENITLNWKPGNALYPVKLDPSQFDQLLAKLVVNARDAITGVGTITIETAHASTEDVSMIPECELAPENCVTLSITDNGSGMDEETRLHIFEPFYTTKHQAGAPAWAWQRSTALSGRTGASSMLRAGPGREPL